MSFKEAHESAVYSAVVATLLSAFVCTECATAGSSVRRAVTMANLSALCPAVESSHVAAIKAAVVQSYATAYRAAVGATSMPPYCSADE